MTHLMLAAIITLHGIEVTMEDGKNGQLCAVGPERAYTAAHVVKGFSTGRWEGQFASGQFIVLTRDEKKDYAVLQAVGTPFPEWHVIGPEPKVGDRLYWRGNNWYARGWYIDEGLFYGVDEDGDAAFGHGAHPGMSGGCGFNAAHEVVTLVGGNSGLRYLASGTPPTVYGYPLWKQKKEVK